MKYHEKAFCAADGGLFAPRFFYRLCLGGRMDLSIVRGCQHDEFLHKVRVQKAG